MRIFAGLPKIDSRMFCVIMSGYYTIHNVKSSTHLDYQEEEKRRGGLRGFWGRSGRVVICHAALDRSNNMTHGTQRPENVPV